MNRGTRTPLATLAIARSRYVKKLDAASPPKEVRVSEWFKHWRASR